MEGRIDRIPTFERNMMQLKQCIGVGCEFETGHLPGYSLGVVNERANIYEANGVDMLGLLLNGKAQWLELMCCL
jgi:hypothetical protein